MDFNELSIKEDRIALMDKIFNHLVDHFIHQSDRRNPCDSLYSKMFKIDRELAQWAIDAVAKIGHANNILIAQRHGYGSYSIVSMLKINSIDFQEAGGFPTYFKENPKEDSNQIKVIVCNGDQNLITVGNNNTASVR